jgi:hypothetical protein
VYAYTKPLHKSLEPTLDGNGFRCPFAHAIIDMCRITPIIIYPFDLQSKLERLTRVGWSNPIVLSMIISLVNN